MEHFTTFIKELEDKLKFGNLPGSEVQMKMAPVTRMLEIKIIGNNLVPKKSAILILFYPENGSLKLIMIKRSVNDSVHSGQIAFPGGKFELTDKNLVNTALREAQEEVGINSESVRLIGSLTKLYIPPSNFDVFPYIGYTTQRPELHKNHEVEKIMEVDFAELIKSDNITRKSIKHRFGMLVDVPCYFIQNEIIWGATAMIISELVEIITNKSEAS